MDNISPYATATTPPPETPRPGVSGRWKRASVSLLMVAMLGLITLLPYLDTFRADFVFDSEAQVRTDVRLWTPHAGDPFYSLAVDTWEWAFGQKGAPRFSRVKSWTDKDNPRPIWGEVFTSHYWHRASAFYDLLYRPLVTLTYYLHFQSLGFSEPPERGTRGDDRLRFVFHATNWAIHLANVLLVFLLMRKLLGRQGGASVSFAPMASFVAAAIFAVHPVQTESVTNIVGRADLLALFFVMMGLLFHIRAGDARGWRALFWATCAAGALALGLLSKENAILLVALALLYDLTLASGGQEGLSIKRQLFTARSLYAYGVFACVIAVVFTLRWMVFRPFDPSYVTGLNNPLVEQTWLVGRLTALKVLGKQLGLMVFPWKLSPDYSYNAIPVFSIDFAGCQNFGDVLSLTWESFKSFLALGLLAAMLLYAWKVRGRRPVVAFLLAALIGSLLPTSNLFINIGTIMAERFLYLPSVWFCMLAGIGLVWLGRRVAGERPTRALVACSALAAVLIFAAGVRTYARNKDWASAEALWISALNACPDSGKVHAGYAYALHESLMPRGLNLTRQDMARLDEAIAHAEAAWEIRKYMTFGGTLGVLYILKADVLTASSPLRSGDATTDPIPPEAMALYRKALEVLLETAEEERRVVADMHELLCKKGKPLHLSKAHGHTWLYRDVGMAFLRLNDLPNAERAFRHAVTLDPFGGLRPALAGLLLRMNREEDAAIVLLEAILLNSEDRGVADMLNHLYDQIAPQSPPRFALDPATGRFSNTNRKPAPIVYDHMRVALLNVVRQLAGIGEGATAMQYRDMAMARPFNAPREPFDAMMNHPIIPSPPRFSR